MDDSFDAPPPALPPAPPLRPGMNAASARLLLEQALGAGLPGAEWLPPEVEDLAAHFTEYRLSRMIGRGGMGAVYLGTDPALGRTVAIKILPPELCGLPGFSDRFRREAWALAQLEHPHIVHVYQFGTTEDGHLYFVMEYVEGSNLAECLNRRKQQWPDRPPFSPREALDIACQVCGALEGAHAQGILHRDIKPANLLMDVHGRLKLVDFGLARPVGSRLPSSQSSVSTTVIGTRDYMAPELLDGGELDARVDVYATGVLLYEMLTGQPPRGAFPPPSSFQRMDPQLDRIVQQAMQSHPDRRYPDIAALHRALLALVPRGGLPRRRWPRAALVGLALGGSALASWHFLKSPPVLTTLAVSGEMSGPALLWEESFEQPAGRDALNHYARFSREAVPAGGADITEEGLTYTDSEGNVLLTRGRAACLDAASGPGGLSYTSPLSITEIPARTLWISLLGRQTAGTQDRFINLCLRAADNTLEPADGDVSADEVLAIGMRSRLGPQVWQIWDRSTFGEYSRAAISTHPTTQSSFLLVRWELDAVGLNERATLWVNPPLSRDPDESAGVSFTSVHSDLRRWSDLRQIRLGAGHGGHNLASSSWIVDEIRLGWTRASVTPVAGAPAAPP